MQVLLFTNILLAVDGSEASLQAARQGIALASSLKAEVTVVVVTVPWASYFARELEVLVPDILVPEVEYEGKCTAKAANIPWDVEGEARNASVAVKKVHRSHRNPYRAILDVAERVGCDVIVMAPHIEHGISGVLLGSETMKVLTHTSIPVLVYRQN